MDIQLPCIIKCKNCGNVAQLNRVTPNKPLYTCNQCSKQSALFQLEIINFSEQEAYDNLVKAGHIKNGH